MWYAGFDTCSIMTMIMKVTSNINTWRGGLVSMCLGTVFMIYTGDEREQIMPDVALMEQVNGEVHLTSSEGETKVELIR